MKASFKNIVISAFMCVFFWHNCAAESVVDSPFDGIGQAAINFEPPNSTGPTLVWKASLSNKMVDSVLFDNGEKFIITDGRGSQKKTSLECEYSSVNRVSRGRTESLGLCGSVFNFVYAYPDEKKARIAILTANCGGSMCGEYSDFYLFFKKEGRIKISEVGTSYDGPVTTKYKFWFLNGELQWSAIENFYDGNINQFGDLLSSRRLLLNRDIFVDARVKLPAFKFLNSHPRKFFEDVVVRSPILSKVTPAEFRAYRGAMSGPGDSFFVGGRFIVMTACMAHFCPHEFGAVVLDAIDGRIAMLRVYNSENNFDFVSNGNIDKFIDYSWVYFLSAKGFSGLFISGEKLAYKKVKNN